MSDIKYRVEKQVEDDDNWYYEGTWDKDDAKHLAYAMFNLGRTASCITDIRIREVSEDE